MKADSLVVATGKHFIDGNDACAEGAIAAGCRVYAGYPITPATDIMEFLAKELPKVGGVVMQAEDEIAAACAAIGASYGGKLGVTSSSGPGIALKSEAMGLGVMLELPLLVINVQRAGPATGSPTKTEQGDLLTTIFGSHGDAPKVVIAPGTIEECFYSVITARKIAEVFTEVVIAPDASDETSAGTGATGRAYKRLPGRMCAFSATCPTRPAARR